MFCYRTRKIKKNDDENKSYNFEAVQKRVANVNGISRRSLNNFINGVNTEHKLYCYYVQHSEKRDQKTFPFR